MFFFSIIAKIKQHSNVHSFPSAIVKILASDSIGLDLPCFAQGAATTLYIKAVAIATVQSKTRQLKKKNSLAHTKSTIYSEIKHLKNYHSLFKFNIANYVYKKNNFDAFFKRPLKIDCY